MPVLQAYAINGSILEKGRWEVDTFENLKVDDMIQVAITSNNPDLLSWLVKHQTRELGLERLKGKKSYSVILGFRIARFRHMLEEGKTSIESMAQILPMNRDIELTLLFLLDPSKSDPKFKSILQRSKVGADA